MSRVAKAFEIKLDDAMERVAEVAEPFYEKALESARPNIDTDAVSSDMLARAMNCLGIDASISDDMHTTTFAEEVKILLGEADGLDEDTDLSSLKFKDGAKERVRFNVIGCNACIFIYTHLHSLTKKNNSFKNPSLPPHPPLQLAKLQNILSIDKTDADYEISVEEIPLCFVR